jgi:hypothetical protein
VAISHDARHADAPAGSITERRRESRPRAAPGVVATGRRESPSQSQSAPSIGRRHSGSAISNQQSQSAGANLNPESATGNLNRQSELDRQSAIQSSVGNSIGGRQSGIRNRQSPIRALNLQTQSGPNQQSSLSIDDRQPENLQSAVCKLQSKR